MLPKVAVGGRTVETMNAADAPTSIALHIHECRIRDIILTNADFAAACASYLLVSLR
jgi:hypothetical protein